VLINLLKTLCGKPKMEERKKEMIEEVTSTQLHVIKEALEQMKV
jgi:hypothetical protein